jgi:lipopolysaccharide transport system ATP-binding protein
VKEELWPVKDVSFEIHTGEIVGIIGRNGAGKSTLLKILSRIIEPTSGRAEIFGRVGTLLEVGTGFHPELTGRENIYLSGIILGMKKREIDRKFDEIVEFAGIDKFIDTPVKRYSSGMYVRLAFAVGAHLEPEILIVDEVLAVGDSQFQKKCLSKMKDVGAQGRTVLFVSHNIQAVTRLCDRVILLEEGRILHDGPTHEVAKTYLNSGFGTSASREWPDPSKAPGGDVARLRAVRVKTEDGRIADVLDIRRPFIIEMDYEVLQSGYVLWPNYNLLSESGEVIFITKDLNPQWKRRPRPAGYYRSHVEVPGNLMAEGTVFVSCYCMTYAPDINQFSAPEVVAFQIIDSQEGDSVRGDYTGAMPGAVRPFLPWHTQLMGDDASETAKSQFSVDKISSR